MCCASASAWRPSGWRQCFGSITAARQQLTRSAIGRIATSLLRVGFRLASHGHRPRRVRQAGQNSMQCDHALFVDMDLHGLMETRNAYMVPTRHYKQLNSLLADFGNTMIILSFIREQLLRR